MKTKTPFIPSSLHPFLILFLSLFLSSSLFAQVPQGIPYQAMIRNSSGAALVNANVTVRFTLHQNTTTGAIEYQETQSLTTNAYGLINTTFGQGTAEQGTFAGINWSNTSKFIQVEANDGNGYVDMGTQQMMSVPYAMYAAQSGSTTTTLPTSNSTPQNGCYSCPTMISGISATTMNIVDAVNYCSNLNEQGYNDWRIPTLNEFEYVRDVQNVVVPTEPCWTKDFSLGGSQGSWVYYYKISTVRGNVYLDYNGQVMWKTVCVR